MAGNRRGARIKIWTVGLRVLLGALLAVGLARLSVASGRDMLILISPERAGPQVDVRDYVHMLWVRWPSLDSSEATALKTVATGIDWQAAPEELTLRSGWSHVESINHAARVREGHFAAQNRSFGDFSVVCLTKAGRPPSARAAYLGLRRNSRIVPTALSDHPWPASDLVVAEADDWTDVTTWARRAGGRVLVVEFPPPPGQFWSRAWLYGRSWPEGIPTTKPNGVPGLLPANRLLPISLGRDALKWGPPPSSWTGANRWFITRQGAWTLLGGMLILLTGGLVVLAMRRISEERSASWLSFALGGVLLFPAWMVGFGGLSYALGLESWPTLAALGLGLIGLGGLLPFHLDPTLRRARILGLFAGFSWLVLTFGDPGWSPIGGTFGRLGESVSTGAWVASYLAVQWSLPGRGKLVFGVANVVLAVALHPWWADPDGRWLLFLALPVFPEITLWQVAGLALVPVPATLIGWTFSPFGLAQSGEGARGINLGVWLDIVTSPGWWFGLVAVVLILATSTPYLRYRWRVEWVRVGLARCLVSASIGTLALSIQVPKLAEASGVLLVAAVIVFCAQALRPVEILAEERPGHR